MNITKFTCACGADKPEDAKYYDGALGYEAIVCRKCGRLYDHDGEHPADDWSRNFVGLKETVIKKGTIIEWQKWPYKVVKTFGDLVHLRPCNYYSGRVRMHSGTTTLKLVNGELTEYNPFLKP